MTTALSLDLVQSQLKPRQKLLVGEETIQEIQKLAEDPDYGPEFLDCYVDHLNILKENPKRNHDQYLRAVKFFSLVEADNSLTDAYIKVFPERYVARQRNSDDPTKTIMRGEASRYNGSQMVSEIRRVATIPISLIHRHLLHKAILKTAELMDSARSEMVQQKAADTLIRELKPAEDNTLNINVEDGSTSVIEELRKATEKLAAQAHRSVMAGVPLKDIAEGSIIDVTPERLDGS